MAKTKLYASPKTGRMVCTCNLYDFPHSYGKQCRAAREFAERHYSDTRQWVDADTALGYYTGTGDLDEALWWYRMDSGGREEAAVRY